MKNKIKKILVRLFIIALILIPIIICLFTLCEKPTYADSGFSTSHSFSSSGSRSDSDGFLEIMIELLFQAILNGDWALVKILLLIIVIVIIVKSVNSKTPRMNNSTVNNSTYKDIDIDKYRDNDIENKVKKYIPDFNKQEFLNNGYKTYCEIQTARMTSMLPEVRRLVTEEMYKMHESQLETMKANHEKNITRDFKLNSSRLKDVTEKDGIVTIETTYEIELYNYVLDDRNGKLIRGEINRRKKVIYEMKFKRTIDNNIEINKCPNCGAPVDIQNNKICKYCNSELVPRKAKWVLAEKNVLKID